MSSVSSSSFGTGPVVVYKQQYSAGYMVSRPKVKKKKSYDAVFPTGVDDGKGARRLLQTYVEESLGGHKKKQHVKIEFEGITDDFKQASFLEQIHHLEMENIPLTSQVAIQMSLNPKHTTEKKKRIVDIARRLKRNDSTLVRVRLNNESIDDTVLMQVTLALSKNKCLQHLMLHNNAITDEGLNLLCMAVRWHPTFHCLWIGANKISDIGAKHVAGLLHRNPRIKEVNLSNKWPNKVWARTAYDLHPHITYIGSECLSQQMRKGCGLTSLSLADQRVRDDGAVALFQSLIYCELRSLNLSGNELTSRCCVELGVTLSNNPLLEILTLSHNVINVEGAQHVATGLVRNTHLHALDLGYNVIGQIGLSALHACLETNKSIGTLVTICNVSNDDRAENTAYLRKHAIFAFGHSAAALHNVSTNTASTTHDTTGEQEKHQLMKMDRHRRHNLAGDLYHAGTEFLSPDELSVILSVSSAVQGSVSDDEKSAVEFGEAVLVESDVVTSNQNLVRQPLSPPHSFAQSPRLPSPWRTTVITRPTDNLSRASTTPPVAPVPLTLMGTHVVVPGIGVLGRSSLSTSYRNLFAATADGEASDSAARSRTNSHESRQNNLSSTSRDPSPLKAALTGGVTFGDTQSPLQLTRKNLQVVHSVYSAPGTPDTNANNDSTNNSNNGSVDGSASSDVDAPSDGHKKSHTKRSALKKKPSFIRTLSNLSAVSVDAAIADQYNSNNTTQNNSTNNSNVSTAEHATRQNKRAAKEYRNSFYGALVTRENTPNFSSAPVDAHSAYVSPSRDLGKTVGIPHIKNMGVLPVRTSIASDRDSAQHFIYLRIATAGDGVDDRPTSLLTIGKDREIEIEKLRASRQTAQYKQDKEYTMKHAAKNYMQKSAEPRVPDKFWADWKKKIRLQYLKGIDKTKGCTSTRLEPISVFSRASLLSSHAGTQVALAAAQNAAHQSKSTTPIEIGGHMGGSSFPTKKRGMLMPLTTDPQTPTELELAKYGMLVSTRNHPELNYQRHLGLKKSQATPGQILAARRKENLIRLGTLQQREIDSREKSKASTRDTPVEKHIKFK